MTIMYFKAESTIYFLTFDKYLLSLNLFFFKVDSVLITMTVSEKDNNYKAIKQSG